MKRYFEYLKYILRHKWFVFWACIQLGVPLWRAIVHDWSKFTPAEFGPYAKKFFLPNGKRPDSPVSVEIEESFMRAWHHHESNNPHHWGYWITFKRDKYRYGIQAHGDGYPILLYDFVEDQRFENELDDDWSAFENGKNTAYKVLNEVKERLNRDGFVVAIEMPETYVREMVAGWIGAGMAINGERDPRGWYEKNKADIVLHARSRKLAENLMGYRSK